MQDEGVPKPRLPSRPSVSPPPLPQIRPEVKEALDNMVPIMSKDEILYTMKSIKGRILEQPQSAGETEAPRVIDPVMQSVLDDIEKAEERMTRGYTVGYPPRALVPVGGDKNEPDALDLIDMVLERLDPLLKSEKVQDQVARLIGAIADKIETMGAKVSGSG